MLRAVALELEQDLDRDVVVRGTEDLDHVVAPSVTYTPVSSPPASSMIRCPSSTRSRHPGSPATPCEVQRISEM